MTPQRLNQDGSGGSAGGSNQMTPQRSNHDGSRVSAGGSNQMIPQRLNHDGSRVPAGGSNQMTPHRLTQDSSGVSAGGSNQMTSQRLNHDGSVDCARGSNQMTPQTAQHKLRDFLASLKRVAETKSLAMAENVRNLIQSLIDGVLDPETFTTRLQGGTIFSPLPGLLPFLKRSLPFLQNSLISGELSIDGIQPGIWINHDLL
jgi:hypothetical protein